MRLNFIRTRVLEHASVDLILSVVRDILLFILIILLNISLFYISDQVGIHQRNVSRSLFVVHRGGLPTPPP
jgi:hypothetical protein